MNTPERAREPIDLARDQLAAAVEADFPGWMVTHDVYGWRATRAGDEPVRAASEQGLRALLPFWGD